MSGSPISAVILAVTLSLLYFFVIFIVFSKISQGKRNISGRVSRIIPKPKSVLVEVREINPKVKKPGKQNRRFSSVKLMNIIYDELSLAGIKMKPEEFGVLWLLLAFVPSGLAALFIGNLMPSVTLAVLGVGIPIFILRQRKKKRTIALETQLGDALIISCNCLRSGLTFQQAIEAIAKEMSEPINVEFARVIKEMQYGVPMEQALNDMGKRLKSADLMLTISAVSIQRQTGGNLSEILETISTTIKDRLKIKKDIRTMTAQGRISGMLIGALPIAVCAILMITSPDYIKLLFTETLGQIMLTVGVIMELIGFYLIKKMVTIEY